MQILYDFIGIFFRLYLHSIIFISCIRFKKIQKKKKKKKNIPQGNFFFYSVRKNDKVFSYQQISGKHPADSSDTFTFLQRTQEIRGALK